jgi:hypothetical protein
MFGFGPNELKVEQKHRDRVFGHHSSLDEPNGEFPKRGRNMTQAFTVKIAAAIAAMAVCSTAAHATPAARSAYAGPVKMSDVKLDSVVAGTMVRSSGLKITTICSFGNNCSGNGGSGNGNTHGLLNIGNGNFAGSSILSGNAIYVFGLPIGVVATN